MLNHEDTLGVGDFKVHVAIEQASVHRERVAIDPSVDMDRHLELRTNSHYDPFKGAEPRWRSDGPEDLPVEAISLSAQNLQTTSPSLKENSIAQRSPSGSDQQSGIDENDWADWADWSDVERVVEDVEPPTEVAQQHEADLFIDEEATFDWLTEEQRETAIDSNFLAESQRSFAAANMGQGAITPFPARAATESDFLPGHGLPSELSTVAGREPANSPQTAFDGDATLAFPEDEYYDTPVEVLLSAATLDASDFAHIDEAEILRKSGELLVQMVDAMMALLRSRAELKNFIRSDNTKLCKADNNPLKFSMSTTDALNKLIADDADGYLPAATSIEGAVEDLKLHQVAMLESIELSVKSLMTHFDPKSLEKELDRSGGLGASIPVTRDAKLWKLFCEQYARIQEEANNDFGNLFGADIRRAYEMSTKDKASTKLSG